MTKNTSRKNILFIITKSETGGAQKFVFDQILSLEKTNRWNIFLVTNKDGWLTEKASGYVSANNIFLDTRIESFFSPFYIFRLINFFKKRKIDLVVSNSANAGFYGRISSYFLSIKNIYVSHGWSSIYRGSAKSVIFNKIEYFLSIISTSILCISNVDAKKARDIIGISPSKINIISNSIIPYTNTHIEYFTPSGNNVYKIITLCRLATPKRVDLLIEAVKDLKNFHLTVIGSGPFEKQLKEKAKEINCTNVTFMGEIKDFSHFYKFDIFALISDSEGLPMSALEAMSFGLPLLLSNVGGCSELIEGNGYLLSNSVDSIRNSLILCSENLDFFGQNSIKLFNSKYNLINNFHEYESYYLNLIQYAYLPQ